MSGGDGPRIKSGCALLPILTGEAAAEIVTAMREIGRDRGTDGKSSPPRCVGEVASGLKRAGDHRLKEAERTRQCAADRLPLSAEILAITCH